MMRYLLILIAALVLAAEQPKAEAPKPPTISDKTARKFWRANTEFVAAHARMEQAKAAMQVAQEALKQECGDYQLSGGQDGEPVCVEKPVKPLEKPKPLVPSKESK